MTELFMIFLIFGLLLWGLIENYGDALLDHVFGLSLLGASILIFLTFS
jgi:hypothetical protein